MKIIDNSNLIGSNDVLPTVARFAVCGSVRPLLTEALLVGERIRRVAMGCSKRIRDDQNAAPVFSGKQSDGSPLATGHQHAHFLCEAAAGDGHISHVTIFAPAGFDTIDEQTFSRLASSRVWGRDGYELQLALLGIGQPQDFGGSKVKAGQSPLLATASVWESRTPFVLTRHLTKKGMPSPEAINADSKLKSSLIDAVRIELAQRSHLGSFATDVVIEPLLENGGMGVFLGDHFTSWLKFRRERLDGGGARSNSHGFGFRLTFPQQVTGPIALGYGCHFGLGTFVPVTSLDGR